MKLSCSLYDTSCVIVVVYLPSFSILLFIISPLPDAMPDVIATKRCVFLLTIGAVCMPQPSEQGIVAFWAGIQACVSRPLRHWLRYFMNERDGLASALCRHVDKPGRKLHFWNSFNSSCREGLLNSTAAAAEEKPQSGARGATNAHALSSFY